MGKAESPKARRFATNLRALIQKLELTHEQAAEKIGVPVNWLRKACYDGIARLHPRNQDRIERLRTFFRLPNADLLWQPSLPKVLDGFVVSVHENELELAVASLKLAYRYNPNHVKVRKALDAIDKAVGIISEEDTKPQSDRCGYCDKELTEREKTHGICRECRRIGAARREARVSKGKGERTGVERFDDD